jgi:hypothetical protein
LCPVPAVPSKSPRTLEGILLSYTEVKDIGNSNKEVHGYLTVFPEYDLLEKKRIIPNTLCQLREAHALPSQVVHEG